MFLSFKRGKEENLKQIVKKIPGTIYLTTDTNHLFMDMFDEDLNKNIRAQLNDSNAVRFEITEENVEFGKQEEEVE